ncbi:MAG: hypothetical protein ABI780_14315 [Ardenticatenales bacterium]
MDVVTELERLSEMNRSGALTAEEFATAKAAILAGRPAVNTGMGADAGGADTEWARERVQARAGASGSAGPGPRYAAPRSGSSVGVVIGVLCALIGLYWIVSALFVAGQAESFMNEAESFKNTMPSGSFSGMPGEVTFTDSEGRPIAVDSPFNRVDSMQQQMKSSISQAAGLNVIFGLVLVVAGIWLGMASRRRTSGLAAAIVADASSPARPGEWRADS